MNTRLSTTLRTTLALALLMSAAALYAAHFIDLRAISPVQGDATAGEAKVAVCIACHGPNGNSIIPTFPRLAGQRIDYLYWRLVDYQHGTRPDSPMTPIAANLSDTDLRDLAAYFAVQIPTVNAAATTPSLPQGEILFREGDSMRGVPPCQGCHGIGGQGLNDVRFLTWPVLRGQHADYIVARLKEFREGKYPTTSDNLIMQSVAHGLSDDEMHAVGAWLANLPPN